ncbi:MAG: divalent-cation tolerance protein CutA [Theionarchaea archaeon]|nr:divalent-cation tolerance protein CutA [Theionarchaea archaeon]MBU6999873.1 divalent-cation tolerance protein CutA [Theionarchaea archaeon]MBU7020063.1 divalent-cation tolerance protein CutA [Theionarchaea archaeon]MBU7034280.1 divalent-cation tolerance protein CutA [Theionarchaea archaeon]MBU7039521.1 divalent-cation tolerance protein CutA [Theionarchaea archaeon]
MEYSFVYFTSGTEKEARAIARKLLEKKSIACANLFPISSLYIWKENLEEAQEYAALVKTERRKVGAVIEEVKRMHSYEVPDIVEIPVGDGFNPFFAWISEVVT